MKRTLTLVLALVMALSVAVPAMAFTSTEYNDTAAGAELAIKLVDVSDGFVSVNFNAVATNRGYVKNEVVCAVVSLYVPKGYDFSSKGFNSLEFTGTNVSLWQDENFYENQGGYGTLNHMSRNAYNALRGGDYFKYANNMSNDNSVTLVEAGIDELESAATSNAQTYQFAIFGKVTGDDAWMKASLKGTGELINALSGNFETVTVNDDYEVGYHNPKESAGSGGTTGTPFASVIDSDTVTIQLDKDDIIYLVTFKRPAAISGSGDAAFAIVTDKKYNCKAMYVSADLSTPVWYQIKIVGGNYTNAQKISGWGVYAQFEELITGGSPNVVANATISALLARYIVEDIIWDEFGLNLNRNGQMKPEWWAGNAELSAEVEVSPWYNEVVVPTEIEIEAPKTGDAISAIGLVLIMIAGLAFVAARKVRA